MAFSEKTFEFLFANRVENSRDYFHSHRDDYENYVIEPMRSLVSDLAPSMLDIDQEFIVEPKVGRCISRINRDTRFSKDKGLYRDNIWFLFTREKKLYDGYPCFWADFGQDGFSFGCGYYKSSSATNSQVRDLILKKDKLWTDADKTLLSQDTFTLYDERYKKTVYPDADERQRAWLDLKNYGVIAYSDDYGLVFSDKLSAFLSERFALISPVYRLFAKAEENRIASER